MKRRAIYVLAAAVLFPIFEKAGVECSQHGLAVAGWWFMRAADILKLALLVLLITLLITVSRQTMKRRAICVLAVALLFPVFQKAGIECSQHGFALAGSCLVSAANILKAVFLVLLLALLVGVSRFHPKRLVQVLAGVLCVPVFLISCTATLLSGMIILDQSRPVRPAIFMRDPASVRELGDLANEMIRRARVFGIGSKQYQFMFAIHYGDVDYRFASTHISKDYDISKAVDAEDTSKVRQVIFSPVFQPTNKVLLDPNDYAFCKQASETLRRIGFDNVQLYDENDIVQYEIDVFFGHNGTRYIYYFCPAGTPPEGIRCEQLDANWYYLSKRWF